VCRFQVPAVRIVGEKIETRERERQGRGYKRTPRVHSRYKSSTRLRWWTELVDTVAARARRVGIVVMDPRRRREITFDGPDGRGRLDLVLAGPHGLSHNRDTPARHLPFATRSPIVLLVTVHIPRRADGQGSRYIASILVKKKRKVLINL